MVSTIVDRFFLAVTMSLTPYSTTKSKIIPFLQGISTPATNIFFKGSQPLRQTSSVFFPGTPKSSSLRASPIHPTSSQQVGQWQAIRTQHRHGSHGRSWQIGRLHMEGWLCGRACIQWGGGGGLAAFFTAAVHGAGSLHGEFQGFLL